MKPFDMQQLIEETKRGGQIAPRSAPTLSKMYDKAQDGIEVVVEFQFFSPRARGAAPSDDDCETSCAQCVTRRAAISPLTGVQMFHFVLSESQTVLKPCIKKLLLKCHVGVQECFSLAQEDCTHELSCLENPSYPFIICHLCVKELKPMVPALKENAALLPSILEECLRLKEEGNVAYKSKHFHEAISSYHDALSSLVKGSRKGLSSEHIAELEQAVFIPVYLNIAACNLKLKEHNAAVRCCRKVLARAPQTEKGHYRMAEALIQLKEFDKANEHINTLDSLGDNSAAVKTLRDAIASKQLQTTEHDKTVARQFVCK